MKISEKLIACGIYKRSVKVKFYRRPFLIYSISDGRISGFRIKDDGKMDFDDRVHFIDCEIDEYYEFPTKKSCTL